MQTDDRRVITAMSRELVRQVAPGELALHSAVAKAYFDGTTPAKRSRRGGGDLLGFGVGEAVVLIAPMVIEFASQVWEALADQAAGATAGFLVGFVKRLRDRFTGDRADEVQPPRFTVEELQYVREVARRRAEDLPLTDAQRALLVESLVGSLAAPEPST